MNMNFKSNPFIWIWIESIDWILKNPIHEHRNISV